MADQPILTTGASGTRRLSAADRVATIISAAETAAEEIRREAEARVRERIAEGERAAGYRVQAAEDEAREILADARQEAEGLQRLAGEQAENAKTTATSEALAILAKANEAADEALAKAEASVAELERKTDQQVRDLLADARSTADEVRNQGLEAASHLRQFGDSLRSNAERVLQDVQQVHADLIARIERVQQSSGRPPRKRSRTAGGKSAPPAPATDDEIEVPEFIPPG